MIKAVARGLGQLFDPRILGVLGGCVLASIACFVAVWFAVDWLLVAWLGDEAPATGLLGILGGLTTVVLAWLLFPLVTSAFVALFLERVARIVEQRHYPDLPPAAGLPWLQALASSLRFFAVVLAANALLLLLLFFPLAWSIGYLVVNGLLIGREYFELVAFRRLTLPAARAMRTRHASELLLMGAGFAFLMTLPLVNLVIPVLATAVMVHRFEDWRRTELRQAGGG
jgi:CysZ protein